MTWKGTVSRYFFFDLFYESASPRPLLILRMFKKIHLSRCTTDVKHTGGIRAKNRFVAQEEESPWSAEPRFVLGSALQQADTRGTLTTEFRRTSVADPGCLSRIWPFSISDPNFFIPDPHQELKYFNPKKWYLSFRKYDPGCSSRIRILYPSGIPDPGVKKAPDPGSSATLVAPYWATPHLCLNRIRIILGDRDLHYGQKPDSNLH